MSQTFDAVALADYTFGPTYARLCTEGATRIGLDGAPAGTVSAAEAEHARRRLHLITRKSPKASEAEGRDDGR